MNAPEPVSVLEAAEPFFRLAREVLNPIDGERPWHADSKDWMVVFSFAGQSITLGDLRRAAALSTVPEVGVRCVAKSSSAADPQDCDWPYCGCDPRATKVVEALIEQGWEPAALQPQAKPIGREELERIIDCTARIKRQHDSIGRACDVIENANDIADAILARIASPQGEEAAREFGARVYAEIGVTPELRRINDALLSQQHPSPQGEEGWLPIESAPKDGTWFLAAYDGGFGPPVGPMQWDTAEPDEKRRTLRSYAVLTETAKATHWRPLPPPPQGEDSGAAGGAS
jgi:hypothetical protein